MLSKDLKNKWKKVVKKYFNNEYSNFDDSDICKIMKSYEYKEQNNLEYPGYNRFWNEAKYVEINVKANAKESEFGITRFDILEFEKEGLIGKLQKIQQIKSTEISECFHVIGDLYTNGKIRSCGSGSGNVDSSRWVDTYIKGDAIDELYSTNYYLKLTPKGINYLKDVIVEYIKWVLPVALTALLTIISLIITLTLKI